MALALAERLSILDKTQLINLRTNALRLQADAGPKAEEAGALLPLIDAELSGRGVGEAKAVRAKPKAAAKPKAGKKAKAAAPPSDDDDEVSELG